MVDGPEELHSLQSEFSDIFDFFAYFVEVAGEVYLANSVSVDGKGPFRVVLEDAWIWDERRPHRFVLRAELLTDGPVRIERLAHHSDEDSDALPHQELAEEGMSRTRRGPHTASGYQAPA